jgi:hypothetical protein
VHSIVITPHVTGVLTDVPAGPRFTPEDVKELHEMFPNIADDVIASVLHEKVQSYI